MERPLSQGETFSQASRGEGATGASLGATAQDYPTQAKTGLGWATLPHLTKRETSYSAPTALARAGEASLGSML